jgi:single-stranded DNA-binding protein
LLVYLRIMNSVNLIGNLATDVELRDVGEEK